MTHDTPLWHGTLTALVTPMTSTGALDLAAMEALVEQQIAGGVEGLVACGTTGESATLSQSEWQQVVHTVVRIAHGRVPVMAGAGTQATSTTIDMVQRAQACGAQGALVVTPFYNKPTASGLLRHYEAVADACDFPIMLYNVPSRTACDLTPATVAILSAHRNIIGVKEATADLRRLDEGQSATPNDFVWLSGDDPTACAFTLMGGHGIISVASNLVPHAMSSMIRAARCNDGVQARQQHQHLCGLFAALGLETNPLPIKTAMALRGQLQENFRLPLSPMQAHHRSALRKALESMACRDLK